jgi:uncharacterized protein (DUF169 family)
MYQELVQRFTQQLQLKQPPIGLAFVEDAPAGVQHTTKGVPSACTFWRLAEQDIFYATGEDHKQCPIGMMTMGFTMPESDQQRAQGLVETMASVQYFSPAEVSALPIVNKAHQSVVYGRLDLFPIPADVVLCIIDTQQAMLVAEAVGSMDCYPTYNANQQYIYELWLRWCTHIYRAYSIRTGVDPSCQ